MSKELNRYCRWNWSSEVRGLLDSNSGIDITENESICIRLAISNNSHEILASLLEYYSTHNPNPSLEERMRIAEDLGDISLKTEDRASLEDLTPQMMDVVIKYTPWLARKALIDRAMHDDVDTVRYLYPHFQEETSDIIEEIATYEAYGVMDSIAQMQSSEHKKAMVYCHIGDLLNRNGIYDKSYEFYEKAIVADPKYIISYIHYANALVEKLTASDSFDTELALKAEAHYRIAIEHNPKYSSAYKKLGILYQKMSENETLDPTSREEYGVKALKAYIGAINTKSDKLKYDSVYKEIEHISFRYSSTESVQKIIAEDVKDERLHELFEALKTGSVSEDDSMSTDTLETLREMSEEDLEYEETDMDSDLAGLTEGLGSSSLVGESIALEGTTSSTT